MPSDLAAMFAYVILLWLVYWTGKMILKVPGKFF